MENVTQQADLDLDRQWENARAAWLEMCDRRSKSKHTSRSYAASLDQFHTFIGKPLARAARRDAELWANELARTCAPATVNQRVAACSAFYAFVIRQFTDLDDRGDVTALAKFNPFSSIERRHVERFGTSKPLDVEQVKALLAQPDRSTVKGSRDYAMMLLAVMTGRRSEEMRGLRWRDVKTGNVYTFTGKRDKSATHEMPVPCWAAIVTYLQLDGRYGDMQDDGLVFLSAGDLPLTGEAFNEMVQWYAQMAGLPAWVHAHTLRHTAASIRLQCGGDVLSVNRMLNHSRLDTTQVYIQAAGMHVQRDDGWRGAYELVGHNETCEIAARG